MDNVWMEEKEWALFGFYESVSCGMHSQIFTLILLAKG